MLKIFRIKVAMEKARFFLNHTASHIPKVPGFFSSLIRVFIVLISYKLKAHFHVIFQSRLILTLIN